MYDYPLEEDQVFNLLGKMRCPTGNTTTIEIDAFKFENVNVKRSIEDINFFRVENKLKTKEEHKSKINTKQKRHEEQNAKKIIGKITDKMTANITENMTANITDNRTVNRVVSSKQPHVYKLTKVSELNKRKMKQNVKNTSKQPHR